MFNATFAAPDLTTLTRLDELGLEVTGQLVMAGRAVLACRVVADDRSNDQNLWMVFGGVT